MLLHSEIDNEKKACRFGEFMKPDGSEPDVVVVDDDVLIRDGLCMVLEDQNWHCLAAANGAVALELLRGLERPPHLILLDLTMPVMNGWEFRQAQLAEAALAAIPTIVLTAVGDVRAGNLELEPEKILRKPVDLGRLIEVVRQHIPWRRQLGGSREVRRP